MFAAPAVTGAEDCGDLNSATVGQEVLDDWQKNWLPNVGDTETVSAKNVEMLLRRARVQYSATSLRGEYPALLISSEGQHPLNRLARFYAAEGAKVVFAPEFLADRGSRGSFHIQENTIILQTNIAARTPSNFFTMTDLHEALHARLWGQPEGKLHSAKIDNIPAGTDHSSKFSSGEDLALSEYLTYRQDLRLALGKLRYWVRTEMQRPAEQPRQTWLDYIWSFFHRSEPVNVQENVSAIVSRARSKLDDIREMHELGELALKPLEGLVRGETGGRSLSVLVDKESVRVGRNRFFAVRITLPPASNEHVLNPASTVRLLVPKDANRSQNAEGLLGLVQPQITGWRQLQDEQSPMLLLLDARLKTLRANWKSWTQNPQGDLAPLRQAIESAHDLAKEVHQHALNFMAY